MNKLSIGNNIKRLREEQLVTQQQLADVLMLSCQAVSKWECGVTVPDVALLPTIADFFHVSLDELFRPNMRAYRNKAQRLLAVYERDIHNAQAFTAADREYKYLLDHTDTPVEDIGCYAYLNECRARYYMQAAQTLYKQALEKGDGYKNNSYYKVLRQYLFFLSRTGRAQEGVNGQRKRLKQEPNNKMNYSALAAAYYSAGDYENTLKTAEDGLSFFGEDSLLLSYAGDACKKLSQEEQAVSYWKRAYAADEEMIDALYSLFSYYEHKGKIEKAERLLSQIIDWNEQRGFEVENQWAKEKKEKLHQSTAGGPQQDGSNF